MKYKYKTAGKRFWLNCYQNIEITIKTAKLNKILGKEHRRKYFLKKLKGSWAESSNETLELLVYTHFSEPCLEVCSHSHVRL